MANIAQVDVADLKRIDPAMRPLLYEALHDLAYLEHVRFGGLQEDLDIRQDGSDRFKVRAVAPSEKALASPGPFH